MQRLADAQAAAAELGDAHELLAAARAEVDRLEAELARRTEVADAQERDQADLRDRLRAAEAELEAARGEVLDLREQLVTDREGVEAELEAVAR